LVGTARAEGKAKGEEAAKAALQSEVDTWKAAAAEVDGLKGALETYKGAVEGVLATKLAGLDDKAKKAVEALGLDPMDKLAWLDKHGDAFGIETVGTPKKGRREAVEDSGKPIHQRRTL